MSDGDGVRTEDPEIAAEKVAACARDIADALNGYGVLGKAPEDVSPQPCDEVEVTDPVTGQPAEAASRPWFVDYSPYVMMYIDYADLKTPDDVRPALDQVGARLADAGWTPRTSAGGAADANELVIEAPGGGYGAVIGGIVLGGGQPRITVIVSSPCLRHPGETPQEL
ncbi:hypothetical protein BTM25_11960 [Actinomadura rubteroloni]|uniref:Uncharacterized protein n=1 Tax=Actinomadura rubteroloni TaxID=1926885 RepID=A0A2P4UP14_9ACTN|nr:hypothetical protein [Actinomadura rubteroloni]POM26788.1 hypothetical protein BTM25_11960 [Actinomadura rubteroloni]